jgi:hypothetical protein
MPIRKEYSRYSALAGAIVLMPVLATASHADQKPAREHKEQQVQLGSKALATARSGSTAQALDCSIQSHPDCPQGTTEQFFTVEIANE